MQIQLSKNSIIGTLGPKFSFHDIVREENFNEYNFEYFDGFNEIFEALDKNKINSAIVAIENSIHGKIEANITEIDHYNFETLSNFKLPICLHLAVKAFMHLEQIKNIYAYKIAWNECELFLNELKASHISSHSNSQALKDLISDRRTSCAAISGKKAIEYYGLETLTKNIHNDQKNITTFSLIIKK